MFNFANHLFAGGLVMPSYLTNKLRYKYVFALLYQLQEDEVFIKDTKCVVICMVTMNISIYSIKLIKSKKDTILGILFGYSLV